MRTHNKKCLDNCIKASLGRWQGWQESNPQRRFWRPELCHLTTPLDNGSLSLQFLNANINYKLQNRY